MAVAMMTVVVMAVNHHHHHLFFFSDFVYIVSSVVFFYVYSVFVSSFVVLHVWAYNVYFCFSIHYTSIITTGNNQFHNEFLNVSFSPNHIQYSIPFFSIDFVFWLETNSFHDFYTHICHTLNDFQSVWR